MDLEELVAQIEGFVDWSHPEKIKVFGWYLHVHKKQDRFSAVDIRKCYEKLNYEVPNLARDLPRLADRTPPEILKDGGGFRLEARIRSGLDAKYGEAQTTIVVKKLLAELPAKVPGIEERAFLEEVIRCLRAQAFRATVVMAWNLAFDHLLRWLLKDVARLATFNARIASVYPKKKGLVVATFDDFEELKEREVIEVCNSASLFNSGVHKILVRNLDRRNTAGHPSDVEIVQPNAEDTITDLVNNVVLKLI